MVIGERLRDLREARELSQGDIEKRTVLLLPLARREWSHYSSNRDSGKDVASHGNSSVSALLRR